MTTEEKAAAFDVLVQALTNRWHDRTWSANCSFLVAQPLHETQAECVPDLLAWAERVAKMKAKKLAQEDKPVDTPEPLKPHEGDYKPQAWEAYTLAELGWWVHLLATRAEHRSTPEKRAKDLEDARNYLAMMDAKLKAIEGKA